MGVFIRFRDIVSSNINAMLDKAEDPEKMLILMIHEIEDTLKEIKSDCAGVMAAGKKTERELGDAKSRAGFWEKRAAIAIEKEREDLARDALVEKRRYIKKMESLQRQLGEHQILVAQYQDDMVQLENKLSVAREKRRAIIQRHTHAQCQRQAQEEIRRIYNSEAVYKFEEFEDRIERMEEEADLMNYGIGDTIQELDDLIMDEDIETELYRIKASLSGNTQETTRAY